MSKTPEINEGYTIKERFIVGGVGFVLATRDSVLGGFVTWQFHPETPAKYFQAHILNTREEAYSDYQCRVEQAILRRYESTGEPPLLPPTCYTVMPGEGIIVQIRRGEMGYSPNSFSTDSPEENKVIADAMNKRRRVTKAQVEAMTFGSMFGWESKLADPRSYDEKGILIVKGKKRPLVKGKKRPQPER